MKPFSPLYFVKENKARCVLLIFMIFLGSYAAYMGGLYITNIASNYDWDMDAFKKLAYVIRTVSDSEGVNVDAAKNRAEQDEKLVVIEEAGVSNTIWTETIMGFENDHYQFTFNSVRAFKTFCQYMDISCDFDILKNGSLIMSDMAAKNAAMSIGDTPDKEKNNIEGDFILDAITDEKGYCAYFIDEQAWFSSFLLINNGYSESEFLDYTNRLLQDYDVYIYNYDTINNLIGRQLTSLIYIYMFIVILMAVIMAVTVNAGFVGLYQRRHYEFAVYRAIGFSRRRIIGKIAGELLFMDLIGLTAGGCIFFLSLYLFNNLVLYPSGKYLEYFHPTALSGLLLCNVIIIIPLMITRCRNLLKADICEY